MNVYDEDGGLLTVTDSQAPLVRREGGLGRSRVPQTWESCCTPSCLNRVFESVVGSYMPPAVCPLCGVEMQREER
jgi:hypothetical protein